MDNKVSFWVRFKSLPWSEMAMLALSIEASRGRISPATASATAEVLGAVLLNKAPQ